MENQTTERSSKAKKGTNPYASKPRPCVMGLVRECDGILRYAVAIERTFENYFLAIGSDYRRKTTFAHDFALAEALGDRPIISTYERAVSEWIDNRDYITELAMVTNWYSWFWYENGDHALSLLYADLYYKCRDAFYKHWAVKTTDSEEERARKEEAQSYFFHSLD